MPEARQPQGCVKTGAVILIQEYNIYVVTDLYHIGDCAYFRWFHEPYGEPPRSVTHHVWIGHGVIHNAYIENGPCGHAVVPWRQLAQVGVQRGPGVF